MAPPRLPPGYHFTPSAEELVHSYLEPWIAGQPLGELASVVCVADVYGSDPAALTERFREFGHDGQHWYFLCVTKWKVRGAAALRARPAAVMNRAVEGGGYWQRWGQAGAGQHSFQYRDADGRSTGWMMVEFRSDLPAATDGEGVKVICKVYLSPKAATMPAVDEERQHVGTKRPAMAVKEEQRDGKVVEDAGNLVPDTVDGAAAAGTTAWLQPNYGGAFIKMEDVKPLVMVRPNGEVVRFGLPAAPAVSPGGTDEP
jgi:hypothetical protein